MATRALHFCNHAGCHMLTAAPYCDEHAPLHIATYTDNRASASERGYDTKWGKFSKWFLSLPENQFCVLHISPNCKGVAECVDHIYGLKGPNDPNKYNVRFLQPACLPCNTLKGKQVIRGTWVYGAKEEADGQSI